MKIKLKDLHLGGVNSRRLHKYSIHESKEDQLVHVRIADTCHVK